MLGELDGRITAFWDRHADPRYDLWKGGSAQGLVSRYVFFKQHYGDDWEITTEVGPAFTGEPPAEPAG